MAIIWNKVTWYSKLLAVIVFVGTIWLGMNFWDEYKEIEKVTKETSIIQERFGLNLENTITPSQKQKIEFGNQNITEDDIKNGEYAVWNNSEVIKFKDGKYENNTEMILSTMSKPIITDLNGDGVNEGVVSVVTSRADSMQELFFVSKKNDHIYTYVVVIPTENSDTVRNIKNIRVDKGVVALDLDILSPSDPHCCPSISGEYKFTIRDGILVKVDADNLKWKTYQNEKYAYQIDYPGNYSIFEDTDEVKEKVIPVTKDSSYVYLVPTDGIRFFFCCEPGFILINSIYDPKNENLSKWIEKNENRLQTTNNLLEPSKYVTFAGEKTYTSSGSEYGTFSVFMFNHNNVSYKVEVVNMDDEYNILSTFKFTK